MKGVDGAKARALYAHGITTPEALGRAPDDVLAKALTAALARRPRLTTAASKRAAAFKSGTTAYVSRCITSLREGDSRSSVPPALCSCLVHVRD